MKSLIGCFCKLTAVFTQLTAGAVTAVEVLRDPVMPQFGKGTGPSITSEQTCFIVRLLLGKYYRVSLTLGIRLP